MTLYVYYIWHHMYISYTMSYVQFLTYYVVCQHTISYIKSYIVGFTGHCTLPYDIIYDITCDVVKGLYCILCCMCIYYVAGLPMMLYVALMAYWSAQNLVKARKRNANNLFFDEVWSTAMTAYLIQIRNWTGVLFLPNSIYTAKLKPESQVICHTGHWNLCDI